MIQLVSKTAMLHRLLLLLSLHLLRCSGATSQEDQTTWKGGANQHNVRKKARKVERSRVLFPQCQIWIVSANKRGWHYTTNQTSEHQPPNIRKSLASHHRKQKDEGRYQPCVILAWKLPSKRMSQVFLLSWGGMAETYLCKYRGIAWSPNSWWDPANWTLSTKQTPLNISTSKQTHPWWHKDLLAFLKTEIPHHLPIFFKTKLFLPSNCWSTFWSIWWTRGCNCWNCAIAWCRVDIKWCFKSPVDVWNCL